MCSKDRNMGRGGDRTGTGRVYDSEVCSAGLDAYTNKVRLLRRATMSLAAGRMRLEPHTLDGNSRRLTLAVGAWKAVVLGDEVEDGIDEEDYDSTDSKNKYSKLSRYGLHSPIAQGIVLPLPQIFAPPNMSYPFPHLLASPSHGSALEQASKQKGGEESSPSVSKASHPPFPPSL